MRSGTARISKLAAAALLGLAATASPALAQSYTLNLSGPSTAAVEQPVVIQATGSNPPTDFFSSWLDVHAIPTSVLSTCPTGYLNAHQVAGSTYAQGGEAVAIAQREDVDAAGNFSMPIVYTPRVAGRFIVCGYTNDGATTTLAAASLIVDVQDGSSPGDSSPPGAKPTSVKKPRVARSGKKLVCSRGKWANSPSRYSYKWVVNGRRQRGATGRTLRVTRKLRGGKVQCRVRATNAAGATAVLSRPLRIR